VKHAAIIAIVFFLCALAATAQKKQPPAHPLDLNAANVKELQQVPGIGPKTAQAIVDFRRAARSGASKICWQSKGSVSANSIRCART